METHLEALLQIALNVEGRADPERIFQINLGRKIDLLKDICRDCAALKCIESDMRKLSPTVKEWGQDRDFLIHSILVGFDDGPDAPKNFENSALIAVAAEQPLDQDSISSAFVRPSGQLVLPSSGSAVLVDNAVVGLGELVGPKHDSAGPLMPPR